ncbi:MAG: hypothetical protein KF861_24365, partial [Planctomycetaceae bacterium]|nr:hypothetical protein [Planctomycetaceae bacterium]
MRWLHGFAVLCTLIPLGAQGQDSLKYAPDLQPGKVTRAEVDLDIRQTLTLAGMPLETANSMFIVARERVGETTADGGRVLLGEYETLQGDMSLPGGITFNFNSNNPDRDLGGEVQEMIGSYFRALVGARWKLVTDADFKVISAVYIDDPFAQVHEFFKSDTNPEQLKQRVNTELARYPGKAVQVGDSWTRTEQFNAGAGQTLEFEQVFTWLGTEARNGKTYDKVGVKT